MGEDECKPSQEARPKKSRHRKKHLYNTILNQMDFYFSDSNITKDNFLGQLLSEDSYVDIKVFLKFNKIKKLNCTVEDIQKAIKKSEVIGITEDGQKLYRKKPVEIKDNVDFCTIYVENIKADANHEGLSQIFSDFGNVVYVSIPKYKHNRANKGFAFIEYETEEQANKAIAFFDNIGCKIPSEKSPEQLQSIVTFQQEQEMFVEGVDDNKIQENNAKKRKLSVDEEQTNKKQKPNEEQNTKKNEENVETGPDKLQVEDSKKDRNKKQLQQEQETFQQEQEMFVKGVKNNNMQENNPKKRKLSVDEEQTNEKQKPNEEQNTKKNEENVETGPDKLQVEDSKKDKNKNQLQQEQEMFVEGVKNNNMQENNPKKRKQSVDEEQTNKKLKSNEEQNPKVNEENVEIGPDKLQVEDSKKDRNKKQLQQEQETFQQEQEMFVKGVKNNNMQENNPKKRKLSVDEEQTNEKQKPNEEQNTKKNEENVETGPDKLQVEDSKKDKNKNQLQQEQEMFVEGVKNNNMQENNPKKRKQSVDEEQTNKKLKSNEEQNPKVNEENVEIGPDKLQVEDSKKKKKNKKEKRKIYIKELGMKVLSKKEWKKLRNSYLDLQRKKMKLFKQYLHSQKYGPKLDLEEETEVSGLPQEVEQKPNKLAYTPGVIVKLHLLEPCMDVKKLKNDIKAISTEVQYVDIPLPAGSEEIYVRFSSKEAASEFCTKEFSGEKTLLEGDEEKNYWEKIDTDRTVKFKKMAKKQRGRDKLLKKAEKESAKHLRFEEEDLG